MDYRIVLDARPCLNGEPLAFEAVSDEPWLMHHLGTIRKARLTDRTEILVPPEWRERFELFLAGMDGVHDVRVVTEAPNPLDAGVIIRITDVFVPRALASRLRRRRTDLSPAVICSIESRRDLEKAEAFVFRDKTLVPSRYFNMPVARAIALRLRHTAVTPNQVSIVVALTGLAAAAAAGIGGYWYDLAAAVLLQVALTLDLTDGYLARLTDRSTRFGHWLDTIVDEIMSFAIIIGVVVGAVRSGGGAAAITLGGVWLMAFHALSANFWISKAYALPAESAAFQPVAGAPGLVGVLARATRRVLGVAHGLDSKFHIISLGLALNLKLPLVAFMAGAHAVKLIAILVARFSTRARLG